MVPSQQTSQQPTALRGGEHDGTMAINFQTDFRTIFQMRQYPNFPVVRLQILLLCLASVRPRDAEKQTVLGIRKENTKVLLWFFFRPLMQVGRWQQTDIWLR